MNAALNNLPDVIIPTKIAKPQMIRDLVARGKLYEQLDAGLQKKLTLVSTPAGFGKTTLVGSWLKQRQLNASWVALDQYDNSLTRFLTYLEAAVDPTNKILNDCLYDRNHSADQVFSEAMLQGILKALSSKQPFGVLVLDDYHIISNPMVHEAFNFLLTHLPLPDLSAEGGGIGTHIMILSRSDPPFPLSRWRLNGELNEIRTDALRFSLKESAELLNQNLQLGLSLDDVAELKSRAEGWVAGLQLAAVSMQAQNSKPYSQFIGELKGSYRMLADYLIEEVFLQQTPQIQEFLLKTSILDFLNGELCDALLQRDDSQEVLESLERNNVFLVPLDHERHWFRYHHFFSDMLRGHPKMISDKDLKEINIRAAQWLAENDLLEGSVKHWLFAEEYEQAAQLVVSTSSQLLNQGKFYTLRTLMEQFPDETFTQHPWMSLFRAWTCHMLEPDELETWLSIAESEIHQQSSENKIASEEENDMWGNVYALRALAASRAGDHEATLSLAPQALELLPEQDTKVRGIVFSSLGDSCRLMGEMKNALEYLTQGKTLLCKGGNFGAAADALHRVGEIQMDLGKLNLAANAYKEAISLEKRHSNEGACYASLAYSGLGQILFEWNQVEEAISSFETGFQLSQRMGTVTQVSCGVSLANAWMELGELEKAEEFLSQYAVLTGNPSIGLLNDSQLVACQIRHLAYTGNFQGIGHLVGARMLSVEGAREVYRMPEFAAYAHSLLIRGDLRGAVNLTSNLERQMASLDCSGWQIKLLAIKAAALTLLGENISAQNTAASAVSMAAKEGYIRTFVSLGEPMLELLVNLTKNPAVGEYHLDRIYLGEVISAFLSGPDKGGHQSQVRSAPPLEQAVIPGVMVEPLTERELEVLKLIAAEQNNTEIADILSISVNTVKTHTANIYSKLGVCNRLQAANRARQLGLL